MNASRNKRKIINDPVHGFVTVSHELIFDIIEHPWFQRLRRIKQLGMTALVYPGALHTRFHHTLGALHLMQITIQALRSRDIEFSPDEELGVLIAILLHDIGHGPFSHSLEGKLVHASHEDVTLQFMRRLDEEFGGRLKTAIEIFTNRHPKAFLHQLVTGQLDMDRLDYLKRDSFYTGVAEGVINTERIISMMTVHNNELVVEAKGIYSIEKFIVARRIMYWQVYYHKTVVAAESMLVSVLERAKWLVRSGAEITVSPFLKPFFEQDVSMEDLAGNEKLWNDFILLDDDEINSSLKAWMHHPDQLLSFLSRALVERRLFGIRLADKPYAAEDVEPVKAALQNRFLHFNDQEVSHLVITGEISNNAYNPHHDHIKLLYKDGRVEDVSSSSEQLNLNILTENVTKYYLVYPKDTVSG